MAAVSVQVSLFVVVAFAEMLNMVRECVGRHEVEVDEHVLRRRSGSCDSLVSGMVFGVIRPAQTKELELVLIKLVFG